MNLLISNGTIETSEVAGIRQMIKEKKLKEVKGLDLSKIKYRSNGKQVYLHVGASICREYGVKDLFTAKNRDELIDQLYSTFFGDCNMSLNEVFEKLYLPWRLNVKTCSKTIKEDRCEYNRFFKDSPIGKKKPRNIKPTDIRDVFLTITADYAISKTRFKSARSVLNGLFQYCCEQGYIDYNPVIQISYSQFKKRFKPIEKKNDYSRKEIVAICNYLSPSSNIYDIAIRFSFSLCARISEIKSIKYSDICADTLKIRRSTVLVRDAYIDNDGYVAFKDVKQVESVIKGASESGFRDFPLTQEALGIAELVHNANPKAEYLFMINGRQLCSDTFNRHLKAACEALDIEYRSSHTIRFTNCDGLYHIAGVDRRDMQSFMGHTTPAMTDHYFNNRGASDESFEKARNYLKIVG